MASRRSSAEQTSQDRVATGGCEWGHPLMHKELKAPFGRLYNQGTATGFPVLSPPKWSAEELCKNLRSFLFAKPVALRHGITDDLIGPLARLNRYYNKILNEYPWNPARAGEKELALIAFHHISRFCTQVSNIQKRFDGHVPMHETLSDPARAGKEGLKMRAFDYLLHFHTPTSNIQKLLNDRASTRGVNAINSLREYGSIMQGILQAPKEVFDIFHVPIDLIREVSNNLKAFLEKFSISDGIPVVVLKPEDTLPLSSIERSLFDRLTQILGQKYDSLERIWAADRESIRESMRAKRKPLYNVRKMTLGQRRQKAAKRN